MKPPKLQPIERYWVIHTTWTGAERLGTAMRRDDKQHVVEVKFPDETMVLPETSLRRVDLQGVLEYMERQGVE
jgi:hypothetical protein